MNPWKNISLSDYEGHMALPAVGQATMLASELAAAVSQLNPKSVALLGCSGGNGLDALIDKMLTRIVCIDVNSSYIAELKERYQAKFRNLECYVSEIERLSIEGEVDFIFGGLVFEYTRLGEALSSVSRLLREGGTFIALVQMPATGISTVTPSPYAEALSVVIGFFQYVEPDTFIEAAGKEGLGLLRRHLVTLESGKSFTVMKFRKGA